MNPFYKNLALWLVISLITVLLFNLFQKPTATKEKLSYTDFLARLEQGQVVSVTLQGHNLQGLTVDGRPFSTYAPDDPQLLPMIREKGVKITARPEDDSPWYMTILISWFPMLLLIGIWIFFMRQMQMGGGKAMTFGKSKARLLSETAERKTFADVAGVEEAKEELVEVIEFLRDPKRFTRLGGRIPKGVLLIGPPGTGKTLLARAVAGEAEVPFFSISGSDFVEMFVGVGASRVRDLFSQGKKNAPCIIFIDEIDAVGRHRGAGLGGGHDEREQTLNQLLVEMDGFESNEGVILISATNRPDVLDPALLRPGRFDRQVVVPLPDIRGREAILKVHSKKTPLEKDIDLAVISRGTPGFSGADLANLVNEAALLAARRNADALGQGDFDQAKDKVLMGVERKSAVISDSEKRTTAYHEAGHALVAKLLKGADPVHKVTIIPRGRALGLTMQLPEDDRHTYHRDYLLNNLSILLGGRVAEEIVLKQTTTGAGNDLERATDMARKMVREWGMSDKVGPLTYGQNQEQIFLGREIAQHRDYSEETARLIDSEVKRLVVENYERAKDLLTRHQDTLEALAEALLEQETLNLEQVNEIVHQAVLEELGQEEAEKLRRSQADRRAADRVRAREKRTRGRARPEPEPAPEEETEAPPTATPDQAPED